jgi:hypothetical protein
MIEGIKESSLKEEVTKLSQFGDESQNIPGWAKKDVADKVIVSESPEVIAISGTTIN